jgi:hypothetical protein
MMWPHDSLRLTTRRLAFCRRHHLRPWTVERLEDRALLSTFVVNTVSDLDVAGGLPTGQESLRQAIEDANADTSPDVDTIDFNIAGSGVQTIQPLSPLPTITHPVFIDGYSQPGSSPNTLAVGDNAVLLIELDTVGLHIMAADTTVRGLDIFDNGIWLDGPGSDTVQGCFIGTDPTGEVASPSDSIYITSGGNLIGTNGDGVNDFAERNLLSTNGVYGFTLGTVTIYGANNVVAGNYIGTDASGTKALGGPGESSGFGVLIGGNANRIGVNGHDVDASAEENVISGNGVGGVDITYGGSQNVVAGNLIGTDVTGTQPLGNGGPGIDVVGGGSDGNLIGTDGDGVGDAFERNIISANQGDGVDISQGSNYNIVAGNFIGTDVTGAQPLGNYQDGINVSYGSSFNRIGTDGRSVDNVGERNIISSNIRGIELGSSGPGQGNLIAGNWIGVGSDGRPLGNGFPVYPGGPSGGMGISINGDSSDQIGGSPELANIIANTYFGPGVAIQGSATGVSVRANLIYNNGDALGIQLGPFSIVDIPNTPGGPHTGPNDLQNYPVLSTAIGSATTQVLGTLNSTPNTTFTLDFYANDPDQGNAGAYGQGQYYLGSTSVTTDGSGNVSFNATGLAATTPGEWVTATATDPGGNTSEFALDVQAVKADTTTSLTSSANPAFLGQPVTFTATVAPVSPASGAPTGTVNFLDGSTVIDTATLSGGSASFTASSLAQGTHTITAVYSGDADYVGSTSPVLTQTVTPPSILVLNPTANGALTLSGSASMNIPGAVVVDSTSTTALSASGNAQVTAAAINVVGGVSASGNASFHPAPTTGVAAVADPLAALPSPGTTGLSNDGSVKLSGNSRQALSPGIYSQISATGNAVLTMNPGTYIIEGGGFTVTGNASVSGSGVMIYNAGSNYPGSGGNFGGITLSGNGTFNLTAPTSGPYAGILIFQSRQNTRALSCSGNAMSGMGGVIYAQSALLSMSGNASLQNPLDVGMLNLSGNVTLTQLAAGSDGSGDASGIANTLLAGNLSVYINDPSGLFTPDELARIQDAINAWDALLAPYNVTISEVSDPTQADITIDTGSTSACGTAADGVLGCFNAPNAEITMLQGWNWYAGSDPTQIASNQYDFETTVLHELGHALGLGGSTDSSSPMYEVLAAGVADRTPTTQDLNIPDPPDGADPQMAAGFVPGPAATTVSPNAHAVAPGSATVSGPAGLMPLPSSASGQWSVVSGQWTAAGGPAGSPVGPETTLVIQGTDPAGGRGRAIRIDSEATNLSPVLDVSEPIAGPPVSPAVDPPADPEPRVIPDATGRIDGPAALPNGSPAVRAIDAALDELASGAGPKRAADAPVAVRRVRREETLPPPHPPHEAASWPSRLAAILLAAGWWAQPLPAVRMRLAGRGRPGRIMKWVPRWGGASGSHPSSTKARTT